MGQAENGAPSRIRTHDPQIRSRIGQFDSKQLSRKREVNRPHSYQWVSEATANRDGPPLAETKTPTIGQDGEGNSEKWKVGQPRFYANGERAATGFTYRVNKWLLVEVLA